jgi:hypothetical protein
MGYDYFVWCLAFLFAVTFLWCDLYNEVRPCALLISITLLFLLRKLSYGTP